jgi:beta-galactosidase
VLALCFISLLSLCIKRTTLSSVQLSAKFGVHGLPVSDALTPYIVPGECGGRADVTWAALHDASSPHHKRGLLVSAAPSPPHTPPSQLQLSALSVPQEALEECRHMYQLRRWQQDQARSGKEQVHVCVDAAHMGLGGDDSWTPNVHAPYVLDGNQYEIALTLGPAADADCLLYTVGAAAQE